MLSVYLFASKSIEDILPIDSQLWVDNQRLLNFWVNNQFSHGIAWSFFWEYFDFGSQSSHFIPAATLTYPVWYFSWDPGIWALLCFCRLFTQVVAKGENMVEAPTYCYYHHSAVFLGQASSAMTTSSTLCKSTSTTSPNPTMEESHVPWDPGEWRFSMESAWGQAEF